MTTRSLTIEDLYAIPALADPALSPDGSQVAYVVTTPDRDSDGYRSHLWTVPTDGSSPARRLTNGPRDSAPRWAPDGSTLAFLAQDDTGVNQVFVMPPEGGGAEQVTRLAGGASDPQWSPDGSQIAVTSVISLSGAPQPDAPVVVDALMYKMDGLGMLGDARAHLFVAALEGITRQLTAGDFSVQSHTWSPDGASLAYGAAATPDSDRTGTTAVYVVDATGGIPRRITPADATLGTPTWFPDGSQLLVVGRERVETGVAKLYVVPASGGAPKPAATLDRNVMTGAPGYPGAHPVVLADGTILFAARDRGCTHLYGATVDAPPAKRVLGDDRAVSGMSVAAGRMAFIVADPTSNGEIHVASLDGSDERSLTTHLAEALPEVRLPTAVSRTFTAPDGVEVHGWLIRDGDAAEPGPLLLDVHGGPHNAWSPTFDGVHLYHHELVDRGWSVLILNPRASDGYGEEFYRATVGAWGIADEQDFLTAVDTLVAEGVADPARLVVTGYSYGGFMTAWLSARHPDRWAAAIPGGIVANMVSQAGTCDVGQIMCEMEVGASPWEAAKRYAEVSPTTYVDQVTAPTLVLHGDRDDRCPVGQAEEWFTALRTRNVPTELVRYPGGSHLFILNGRPSHRADWCKRIVDWSVRHTSGSAAATRPLAARTRGLRARLEQLCAQHQVPGAAVTVLHGDEVVTATTGVRSVDSGEPVTAGTSFQIGSNTKLYTATLAMQLVDAGQIGLDDPVVRHVPELRLAQDGFAEQITVRHLLTHVSGIPGDVFGMGIPFGDDAIERFVADLSAYDPLHPVGELWSYCNAGWVVLGRLIEKVTGETFATAWRSRLIDPLGATRTRALPQDLLLLEPAIGHVPGDDGKPVVAPVYATSPASLPAGSIPAATSEDVLRFLRMHLDGGVTQDGTRLLSAESVRLMQQEQVSLPSAGAGRSAWGLGWGLSRTIDGRRVIGHGGGTLGQVSVVEVLPDERLAVVVLTNGYNGAEVGLTLVRELFASLAGAELPANPVPLTETADLDLSRIEGEYGAADTRVVVSVQDGAVTMAVTSKGLSDVEETNEAPLQPVTGELFLTAAGTAVHFLRPAADGRPEYVFAGRAFRRTP